MIIGLVIALCLGQTGFVTSSGKGSSNAEIMAPIVSLADRANVPLRPFKSIHREGKIDRAIAGLRHQEALCFDPDEMTAEARAILRFRSELDRKMNLHIDDISWDLRYKPSNEWDFLCKYDDRGWNLIR